MSRPLTATIDSSALKHNFSVVKSLVPHAKIWCVVKANAYGHGLERCVRAFSETDGLALIEIDRAAHLRETGWKKPILLLEGFFDERDLPVIAENGFETAVHNFEQIEMLERARLSNQVDVHLKMNTGMNRLGFIPSDWDDAFLRLKNIPYVRNIRFMTHFANAELQSGAYVSITDQLEKIADKDSLAGEFNLSNSAAILLHPELKTDWVRPGIMLYGATPGGKTAEEYGLKPAMTLSSRIIAVQNLNKGDAVGYGSIFVADKSMRIGVVACGYADGYPRCAPENTPVLVDGKRTRLIGRVSMDMLTVDLTGSETGVGGSVTLWGDGLPIDEVAECAGTIGYELMCAVAPRVPMVDKN